MSKLPTPSTEKILARDLRNSAALAEHAYANLRRRMAEALDNPTQNNIWKASIAADRLQRETREWSRDSVAYEIHNNPQG